MIICGIDPGKKGAAVVLNSNDNQGYFIKLEYNKSGVIKYAKLEDLIVQNKVDKIVLEKVNGRGGWAAGSNFNYGLGYGQILLTLTKIGIPWVLKTPQQWQKKMHVGADSKLDAKQKSLQVYERLFPTLPVPLGPRGGAPHDGVIDALLIASYGLGNKSDLANWKIKGWESNHG